MSTQQPATIALRTIEQIDECLSTATDFQSQTDFFQYRMEDELVKLQKVDAIEAFKGRAYLALLRGDLQGIEDNLDKAERLRGESIFTGMPRLICYGGLLYATKALNLFAHYVDVQNGTLSKGVVIAASIGAFQQYANVRAQAHRANIELPFVEEMKEFDEAVDLLREYEVSDADCAKVMDAAGEVLRNHGHFWNGDFHKLTLDKGFGSVGMQIQVCITAQEAASMTLETADKLIERDLDTLPFYVSFLGIKE